jgi:hypothetical protein
MNLSDDGGGMVALDKPSTAFVEEEKNVSENKTTTMDSTPISDIMDSQAPMDMMGPPMMNPEPKMQGVMPQMMAPQQMMVQEQEKKVEPTNKNPFNLTDDQMTALIVAACTALAVSKPVQNKLVTSIPKFLDEQGNRSAIGLASTGLTAAIVFYVLKMYVVKR